jgi:alpha-L-arabinofuranosidase
MNGMRSGKTKKTFTGAAVGAVALATFALVAASRAQQTDSRPTPPLGTTLTIHADRSVAKVSPTFYGLMTEEINHAFDGGLYAEMVRNRTMRPNWDGVNYWTAVMEGNSVASIAGDKSTGPSTALPFSLKVSVTKADARNFAGVRNDGYWGMAVKSGDTYHGSFYAKADDAAIGAVTASLVDNTSGKVVASATVVTPTSEWKQYTFTLKPAAAAPGAYHLTLSVAHPGTLWLQLVSLFPPTYHDRANGNRIDLMDRLAAMQPKFLRLPGGNYLEGDHINERFNWKETIGPLVDRPTHRSPWDYQSTDGMGLLEFLEWCEDLRMDPVLAVFAGYALHQETTAPGPALEPYVQDALDEIEYVTGDASTKWGAERVKDGHPAPFKLTYVEIGNEDEFDKSGNYEGRYEQFYKAIKAKYPNLQLISTVRLKTFKPDVQDDHYYRSAVDMMADAAHYDKTDRNGPKIFVGEWATIEGVPTPTMNAALADAAWLTGLERNSDIVVMASYAPLFVNVNPLAAQWGTNLIGYNSFSTYGSPSYWMQVMFASALGTDVVASELSGDTSNRKLFYSVTSDPARHELYLKLVNVSSTEQILDVHVEGGGIVGNPKVTRLAAEAPTATNSIDAPERIIPKPGDAKSHALPPYSISVYTYKLK